ncbi:endonuclease VII domain-containing protein [Actinomadura atramentaria]|uniref:endonuclease VII domain-containing protein n=1 Tax=Actinomadura atramentaria TaxID=1990 RepID=UPI0003A9FBF5|nr:endonuclease VII domain-containing protein [Actinomadura atramentaria]
MTRNGMRRCAKCERNRQAKFYSGPRARVCASCRKKARSAGRHERRVQLTYGLGPGEYEALLAAQGGRCAICKGTRRQRLSVDHDHKTGVVRGLLCRLCNGRLLTAARDSAEILRAAADYLDNPPALIHIGQRIAPDHMKKAS